MSFFVHAEGPSDLDFGRNIFGKNRAASFAHRICDTTDSKNGAKLF